MSLAGWLGDSGPLEGSYHACIPHLLQRSRLRRQSAGLSVAAAPRAALVDAMMALKRPLALRSEAQRHGHSGSCPAVRCCCRLHAASHGLALACEP